MSSTTIETLQFVGKRYQLIKQLGEGGMGTVYRAKDRLSGKIIALKRVNASAEKTLELTSVFGDANQLYLALAQEFRSLASLRHPNIISVLDYGFDENKQPFFTMDILENSQDIFEATRDQPLTYQIELLIQLLQALVYLHRRGIIHRDLKPDNVQVIGNVVKVLDFGLALTREQAEQSEASISGTLPYIAPETFSNQPSSKVSDLYAVGVIAYQIFAGKPPFDFNSIAQFMNDVMYTIPDYSQIELIDQRIRLVLERLLSKAPEDRYQDAAEVIHTLSVIAGQSVRSESSAIRESFLQAAQFVGRTTEQETLIHALRAMVEGHGALWLIGGEGGVGKSRLLDEFRIQALVQGALVLRGQAPKEQVFPYQIWLDALRWISSQTELPLLDYSILKTLIPDISDLLGAPVPDAPVVDPQVAQDRLLNTIENLFDQQPDPIVVVLEDLHWASAESLLLLGRLSRNLQAKKLLILGSYRDDEKPNLPAGFPNAQVMKLPRLNAEGIKALSRSMLGDVGSNAGVVALLNRETEGNAFFVVEIVRALAESVGQLENIGRVTLPPKIFAGGMQAVITRRLSHVVASNRPLLEAAAVAGRELNLTLLQAIAPQITLDDWLNDCAESAVIEFQDGKWRFAHDKLREGLLTELESEPLAELHGQVAQAIEKIYPNAPEQAAILAFHWGEAHNIDKEKYYVMLAGEYALSKAASHDAVIFLERALSFKLESPAKRALIERQLGEALSNFGHIQESTPHFDNALKLLGEPLPTSSAGWILRILGQAGKQLWHRLAGIHPNPALNEKYVEMGRIHFLLSLTSALNNQLLPGIHAVFRSLNCLEQTTYNADLARSYATMSYLMSLMGAQPLARLYERHSLSTVAKTEAEKVDLAKAADAYYNLALYEVGVPGWKNAETLMHKAQDILLEVRNPRLSLDVLESYVFMETMRGRFDSALASSDIVVEGARRRLDDHLQLEGSVQQSTIYLYRHDLSHAVEAITRAIKLINPNISIAQLAWLHGVAAKIRFDMGDMAEARSHADKALELVRGNDPTIVWVLDGFSMLVEAYLDLWKASTDVAEQTTLKQHINDAFKKLKAYAGFFPVGKSRTALMEGLIHETFGGKDKAIASWRRGIAIAKQNDILYDEAWLSQKLAEHLDASTNGEFVQRAKELFDRLGIN